MSDEAGATPAASGNDAGPTAATDAPAAAGPGGGGEEEYRVMAERMKDEGNAAFKQGKYKEAIDLYTRGLQIDPDNHVLYSNRSAAYLKENERGQALKDAERLMELKPDWPKSFSRKGAAQHALTRYTAATETYEAGLRLFPDDKALQDGKKAAEEAYEVDKQQRFERARLEREAAEARKKHQEELKKKAAALREKEAAAAKGSDDEEAAASDAGPKDELADFFSEVGTGGGGAVPGANVQREVVKVVKEDYAKQDLGTSEAQMSRLLQPNYQWKNLNPFDVLQLGTDATEDDVKMRYRKLSTLVHPDKCLENVEQAREAFEEVKKAYMQLVDGERRAWCLQTINETRKRTLKERRQKLAKGVTAAQLGPEEEAVKKAVMKEFAEVEMRKRNAERHQQAYKQFEQQKEDDEKRKLQQELEFDKKWADESRREGRVGNWRDFQKGPGAKRAKVQGYAMEENVKEKKHGQHEKEQWRKSWK